MAATNRYPSGGAPGTGQYVEQGRDWNAADWFVSNGANASVFTMYIISPDGDLREFDYADKAYWYGLKQQQRENGTNVPDPLVSDGSTC